MRNLIRLAIAGVVAGVVVGMLAFAADEPTTPAASAKAGAYPLDYCVVSMEKLGGMGDPVVKTYDGREVQFCCGGCVKKFEKDQASYMKKLDDAIIADQKPTYPVETCVVSGEPLGHSDMGDPVDFVYQNRLVRFCCNNCVKAFKKDPDKFLAKLDAAEASKSATPAATEEGHQH